MDFFKRIPNIDFMGRRRPFMFVSLVVVLVSFLSFGLRGFSFGLDFTGGAVLEAAFAKPIELASVRSALEKGGFGDAVAQNYGSVREVLIRIPPRAETRSGEIGKAAFAALSKIADNSAELRRTEFVGPQVGKELAEKGGLALLISLFGILIYVALRFEYRFAVGAIVATMHDVIITVGVFSLFQIEFDLNVLAAVLAVIGYSLNDTVVVYDRIRENFRKVRKGTVEEIVNLSVNQTLSRTIMTSVATLMTVVALYFFGGATLQGFSLALIVGIVVGTYSSIYIASAATIWLGISRSDLLIPPKEGAQVDKGP